MQGERIAITQQILESGSASNAFEPRGGEWIECGHVHFEGQSVVGHLSPDAPEANNAKTFARQLVPKKRVAPKIRECEQRLSKQ